MSRDTVARREAVAAPRPPLPTPTPGRHVMTELALTLLALAVLFGGGLLWPERWTR